MSVMIIHAEFTLVIRTPQTKCDKPSVQQARMVRIFDVLLHQLPVAWNALTVVTQYFQLSAIEQSVKVLHDGGAHEVFK